ncbi:MAG TPA: extracellular solute-binding protein [Firmicutes bacterium]|nr:extracellular solute-binding protein [Bacillota bacterium]
MRRLIWIGLLAVFLKCGSDETQSLVFWQFQRPDIMEPIIDEFERTHPGIDVKVETLTWQSGFEKIVMAFSSGDVPDLLELGSTWIGKFAAEGTLEDLSSLVEDMRADFMMWGLATFQGKTYGIPWLIGSRVLFYNRDLFRRGGLDPNEPPETWDDLLRCAREIDAVGEDIYGFGMNAGERYVLYKKFMPFAWSAGGQILSDDLTRCVIDSPQNLEALKFYLSLKPFSVLDRQDMIDEMFKQGRVGMMISGGWNLKRIPEDAPDLDFGVALVPRHASGQHISFAGAEILVIPRGSQKQKAFELARFLVRAENALKIASEVKGVQPASRKALYDPYYESHPMERILLEQCMSSKSPPTSPRWVEIEEIINARLEECLYGRLSPEEALSLMQDEISNLIAP